MGLSDDPEALNRAIRLGVMEEDLPTLENGLDTVVGTTRRQAIRRTDTTRRCDTDVYPSCRALCFR